VVGGAVVGVAGQPIATKLMASNNASGIKRNCFITTFLLYLIAWKYEVVNIKQTLSEMILLFLSLICFPSTMISQNIHPSLYSPLLSQGTVH
jgi:hypothetical protein